VCVFVCVCKNSVIMRRVHYPCYVGTHVEMRFSSLSTTDSQPAAWGQGGVGSIMSY
jgi:hypothetical protein